MRFCQVTPSGARPLKCQPWRWTNNRWRRYRAVLRRKAPGLGNVGWQSLNITLYIYNYKKIYLNNIHYTPMFAPICNWICQWVAMSLWWIWKCYSVPICHGFWSPIGAAVAACWTKNIGRCKHLAPRPGPKFSPESSVEFTRICTSGVLRQSCIDRG